MIVHVYPENDLIDHDTDTDSCVCGPEVEAVFRDDGSNGWLISHHMLNPAHVHGAPKETP